MFIGRFAPIGLLLALAESMINRKRSTEIGLRTDSITFTIVLVGSILLLVVLTFFPFLALGPILQFFQKLVNGFRTKGLRNQLGQLKCLYEALSHRPLHAVLIWSR